MRGPQAETGSRPPDSPLAVRLHSAHGQRRPTVGDPAFAAAERHSERGQRRRDSGRGAHRGCDVTFLALRPRVAESPERSSQARPVIVSHTSAMLSTMMSAAAARAVQRTYFTYPFYSPAKEAASETESSPENFSPSVLAVSVCAPPPEAEEEAAPVFILINGFFRNFFFLR